jgi:divalent metal cation (Fe/Co/Zn/Cd) transporter
MNPKKELTFLDAPENRMKVRRYFYLSLIVLLIVDLFIHKHGHYSWETVPAFYAAYGFIACVGLIFIAKLLRLLVKRKENYYD